MAGVARPDLTAVVASGLIVGRTPGATSRWTVTQRGAPERREPRSASGPAYQAAVS